MTTHASFRFTRTALFVAAALLSISQTSLSHQFEWYDGRWAQESSDIAPHPGVTYGKLPNGLRWAVIPNNNPKGRVALRLAVEAGSLMEEPHELGIAHYLEHMAFNGSEHFPAGTLIPFFQKHGMNFGGDTNAYTTLGETVYQLNLAKNDSASLREGLSILRDMADGLTLSPKEVDEERGIILSEKRARENENTFASDAWRDFLYAGSRYTHPVIGTEETLEAINADTMRAFYDKWYVPGRMILVFAGDVQPSDVEKLVTEQFGSMKAAPLPAVSEIGQANREGIRFFVQQRPISGTQITVEIMTPELPVVDNEARSRDAVMSQMAQIALNRRLAARSESDPSLWSRAFFADGRLEPYSPSVVFTAMTPSDDWKDPLKALREELLRAKLYGLTEAEFTAIRSDLLDTFERAVKQQSSWTNDNYADHFVNVLLSGGVFTSAEQDLDRVRRIFKTLTLKDVNTYFEGAFAEENRRIRVSGPVKATESDVAQYWKSLDNMTVSAPANREANPFPYLPLPAAVDAPALTEVKIPTQAAEKMVLYRATLPDGTELILQPLPFEKGTVTATLTFGDGLMGVTDEDSPLAREALSVLGYQGLGKYTELEATTLFGARGMTVKESVGTHSNLIAGSAQSQDVALLLEGIWTQFKDPTISEINRERAIKALEESRYWRHDDVDGVLRSERLPFLTGDRLRTQSLEPEDVRDISTKQMLDYLEAVRTRGPRTLVISGDFNRETAALWAARLFGTESTHPAPKQVRGLPPVFPETGEKIITVDMDTNGKAVAVVAFEAQKAPNDRARAAARQVAAALVDDRLRDVLREKLGISYSPFATYHEQLQDDGFGFLMMQISTKSVQIDQVRKAVDQLVKDLAAERITADELERLKKPLKTEWTTQRKTNALWNSLVVSEAASGLPLLKWNEEKGRLLDAVTPADVERELKAFFDGRRADLIVKSGRCRCD